VEDWGEYQLRALLVFLGFGRHNIFLAAFEDRNRMVILDTDLDVDWGALFLAMP